MKIIGRRPDGAVHVAVGAGMFVVLKDQFASPPRDRAITETYGPWTPVFLPVDEEMAYTRQLQRSRVQPMHTFALSMSFDQQRDLVQNALRARMGIPPAGTPYASSMMGLAAEPYIPQNGLGSDWVVYCTAGTHYGLDYTLTNGVVTFEGDPEMVVPGWESLNEQEDVSQYVEANADKYQNCRNAPWFKKWMAGKKKKALTSLDPASSTTTSSGTMPSTGSMPGSLPNLNKPL